MWRATNQRKQMHAVEGGTPSIIRVTVAGDDGSCGRSTRLNAPTDPEAQVSANDD